MKIHDEMSQISVPEDLDEKTYQSILNAEKTVQKNRFRKKCTWSVLSCLVIIFGIIHVTNPAMAENIPIVGSNVFYTEKACISGNILSMQAFFCLICKNDRFSSPRNSYHRNVHAQTGALL